MSLWDHNDYLEEPSDDEENQLSSSEDEVDVLLNGPAKRKRRLIREVLTGESESSSSDDDFVKEMAKELDSTVRDVTAAWAPPPPPPAANGDGGEAGTSGGTGAAADPEFYDDIYFETSSEEEAAEATAPGGVSARKKKKLTRRQRASRRVLTNDELMYDPAMDDADQEWVDKQRRRYRGLQRGAADGSAEGETPSSDAVLNCPACMSTLCLDCQRHELYSHQYRAMFVLNCTVNRGEVLRYRAARPRGKGKQQRRRRGDADPAEAAIAAPPGGFLPSGGTGNGVEEEQYFPVTCNECQTEVAVFDKDEVYHFFNIIASHS